MDWAEMCIADLDRASLRSREGGQRAQQVTASIEADPGSGGAQFVGMPRLHGDPGCSQHRNRRKQCTMLDSVPAAIFVILEVEEALDTAVGSLDCARCCETFSSDLAKPSSAWPA